MKKTQTINFIIDNMSLSFDIYPIVEQETEYKKVNKDGEVLIKKVIQAGTQAKYIYIDGKNKEYDNKDIFTNFNNVILQGIKRTENVKKFKIVDRTEIYNLTEFNISLLNSDLNTINLFNEKVGNKAIEFNLKKSSVGFNFYKAYILKLNNELVLISGKGDLNKAIINFKETLKSKKEVGEVIVQKVLVNADDLEIEV